MTNLTKENYTNYIAQDDDDNDYDESGYIILLIDNNAIIAKIFT